MSYGTVTINGQTYIEREQSFPMELTVSSAAQINTSLILPGTADFWLKALTRETIVDGAPATRRFKFRLGNSDGSTWYQSGGAGGTTDLVIDSLLFGTGQFPFVLNPYIFYAASGSIPMNIIDVSGSTPYTIYFNFRGSYLIPAQ